MNRRNFFKVVTGFVAGVFGVSAVAKEKPKLTVAMLQKAKAELVLNRMERLRIEAAEKAANPPLVFNPTDNWRQLPPDGNWTHVVCYSKPGLEPNTFDLYLDGKLVV